MLQNSRTKEILNYKSLEKWRNVAVNQEHILFKQSKSVKYEARHDLVDTEINVCSHDLLQCFTNNFDYHNLKDDFVLHVAESELQEHKIAAFEIAGNSYFNRIADPRTYDAVSRDIIRRYAHPFVVDAKILASSQQSGGYQAQPNNKYFGDSVHIDFTCSVSDNTIIGPHSKVAAHTRIIESCLGSGCKIGNRCVIRNAYIWDNVTVEDDCVIENAVICSGAVLGKGAVVKTASILSYNVRVKAGAVLEEATVASRLEELVGFTRHKAEGDFYEEGFGFAALEGWQLRAHERLGGKSLAAEREEQEESDYDFDDEIESQPDEGDGVDPELAEEGPTASTDFFSRISHEFTSGSFDTLEETYISMNSLKMGANKTSGDCILGFYPEVLNTLKARKDFDNVKRKQLAEWIKEALETWTPLFNKFVHSVDD